jgi:uncharacterized protein
MTSEPASTPATAPVVDTTDSPYALLRPVGVGSVRVHDGFWQPRLERNRTQTLPAQQLQCETTGALDNFRRAAGLLEAPFQGRYYSDSDVYKWVEAAAWSLASGPDPALSAQLDDLAKLFAAAQDDDGYLNTYFSVDRTAERWTDLEVLHEMYCLGHLTQAAVAHHRATGQRSLLDVATRACDHVFAKFTPGQTPGACGHPGLEMALVELYRTTGETRWLRLAAWQLESRGKGVLGGGEYLLDHAPLRAQDFVTGHAVRALYLYAAAADVVLETGDQDLLAVVERLWADLSRHKTAVTGGVGARWDGESFGDAYELPDRAYNETCAAIAHIFLAWRLLLLTGDGTYREAVETALYNGVLPGLSASGTEYFYQNPLADAGRHRRRPWFPCACCPPNIARLLASLPGYAYTTSDDGVWVQLYLGSTADLRLADGTAVRLQQRSELPWQGRVDIIIEVDQPRAFTVYLPEPSWAGDVTLRVGDEVVRPERVGGYLAVRRTWQPGDTIRVELDLPVRLLSAHPRVASAHGRVAVTRGPLVYCVEQADHPGVDVADLGLTGHERWTPVVDLLGVGSPGSTAGGPTEGSAGGSTGGSAGGPAGALVTLTTIGRALETTGTPLHRPYDAEATVPSRDVEITAIPYYAWANRVPGPMRVFLPLLRQ